MTHYHALTLNLAHAVVVTGSTAVDVTYAVPTPKDETVVALAVAGPLWGHCIMYGRDHAPDMGGAAIVNAENAGNIVAAIMAAFDAAGAGPALAAAIDQARAGITEEKARQAAEGE